MLSKEEIGRYSRHIQLNEIGIEGQEKIKNASVLVIGAGGLGCSTLTFLTAMGIGKIGILDFDIISHSNLQRQFLYTIDDLGKEKVEIAIKKLKNQNPNVNFVAHIEILTSKKALEIFPNYDLILDATDSIETRYTINDTCVKLGKTFVYGSIHKFEGQVSVFNYKNLGPTYRCLFPLENHKNQFSSCQEAGVLGVLPGVIGTIQANEIIKIILGLGEVLSGKLLILNLLNYSTQLISFKRIS